MSRPVLEPRTTSKVTSNTNSRPSSPLRYGNCPNIERKFKVFKPQNLDYVYIYECSYVYIYVPKVRCLCCNRDFRSVPINMKVSCLCYNRDFLAGLYHDSHNSHYSIINYDSSVVIWGIFKSGTTLEA